VNGRNAFPYTLASLSYLVSRIREMAEAEVISRKRDGPHEEAAVSLSCCRQQFGVIFKVPIAWT
jgi:hypothetical protein